MKGFPHKNIFGFPIGWKNLGKIRIGHRVENGETVTTITTHGLCRTRIRVGKENETLFRFCPRCLVKVE